MWDKIARSMRGKTGLLGNSPKRMREDCARPGRLQHEGRGDRKKGQKAWRKYQWRKGGKFKNRKQVIWIQRGAQTLKVLPTTPLGTPPYRWTIREGQPRDRKKGMVCQWVVQNQGQLAKRCWTVTATQQYIKKPWVIFVWLSGRWNKVDFQHLYSWTKLSKVNICHQLMPRELILVLIFQYH